MWRDNSHGLGVANFLQPSPPHIQTWGNRESCLNKVARVRSKAGEVDWETLGFKGWHLCQLHDRQSNQV